MPGDAGEVGIGGSDDTSTGCAVSTETSCDADTCRADPEASGRLVAPDATSAASETGVAFDGLGGIASGGASGVGEVSPSIGAVGAATGASARLATGITGLVIGSGRSARLGTGVRSARGVGTVADSSCGAETAPEIAAATMVGAVPIG